MSKTAKKPADDSTGMKRHHPESRANKIAALQLGETYSEAVVFEFDFVQRDEMLLRSENLRATFSSAVARAGERTAGHKYRMNSGSFIGSTSGDIVVTVAVTRIE